ncbi:hypothetical protein [Wohlfahrtiimonas populi]|uniref:hypothetical protein n=1 Tax=Wohlfahrtiimonas populi TaxID=1940240 RepID=UPI00098D6B51|nr:hypothetical protein [Wohlfahrtiimonas populi]
MKIQISIYNVLITRLLPIILLSGFFVLLIVMMISEPKTRYEWTVWACILGLGALIIGLFWSMLDAFIRYKKGVLILTDEGFYCPYLLAEDQLIRWQDIAFIQTEVLNARGIDVVFVVIAFANHVPLKHRRYMMDNNAGYFTKKYSLTTLVFSTRIMSDYMLQDICDVMNFYYKKAIGESFEITTVPTTEHWEILHKPLAKERKRTFVYYAQCFSFRDYFLCFSVLLIVVTSVVLLFLIRDKFALGISFSILASFIIFGFLAQNDSIDKYSARRLKPVAIDMDKDWFYQINTDRFFLPLPWKNLKSFELKRIRKGRFTVPYLLVKYVDYNQKIYTAKIHSELLDTSIYELHEIMQQHYEKKTQHLKDTKI